MLEDDHAVNLNNLMANYGLKKSELRIRMENLAVGYGFTIRDSEDI